MKQPQSNPTKGMRTKGMLKKPYVRPHYEVQDAMHNRTGQIVYYYYRNYYY